MAESDSNLTEEWRPVVGWEAQYQVSSFGRLRHWSGVLISQSRTHGNGGYMQARLSQPRRMVRVHRLVAKAFIPPVVGKPCINHLDCDPSNNRVVNLEWCTQQENIAYAGSLGRMSCYWKGRRSPNAHLSDADVRQMRQMYLTGQYSWEKLGVLFGVSKHAAGRVVRGETYADVR